MQPAKYSILKELTSDAYMQLYRVRQSDHDYLLKVLKKSNDLHGAERLDKEYNLSKILTGSGFPSIVKFDKDIDPGLLMEDFQGIPLSEYIKSYKITLISFLKIAIQLAKILEELQNNNVIHNNLRPQIFLINEATLEIKMVDYSMCSLFNEGNVESKFRMEVGGLDYISPEQTGKTNHVIDYRSDLYSMGVILYELITSKKPFDYSDANELIHFHVARNPSPVYLVNPEIPVIVSNIISSLLSKNAQNRYQSAFGLRSDLQKCLIDLEQLGRIRTFKLSESECNFKILVPQKLYERKDEIECLKNAFFRACEGSIELAMVSGPSGVGKSTLINQVSKTVIAEKGYFLKGKFNQFQDNNPYYAIIEALKEFVNIILTEDNSSLKIWKSEIEEAVSVNGKVLTDVIPNLELLIGVQPEVPLLPPIETQNRFNYVAGNFFNVIANKNHPLVLFMDDMQWADQGSLNMVKVLLSRDIKHFLIIVAYRSNEMLVPDSVLKIQEEIKEENISIQKIPLYNLSFKEAHQLISDSLNMPEREVTPLSSLIFTKTVGNPFFVIEFLKSLYEENLLVFDFNSGKWKWDLAIIKQLNITENVVELVGGRIQKLQEKTQKKLILASCLGNLFSLEILSLISEEPAEQVLKDLQESIREGLIIQNGKYFKFSHDRVQQAVYFLNHSEEIKQVHLRTGKLLLRDIPEKERDSHLFDIANQFIAGIELITGDTDKHLAADLFLLAGRKAKMTGAFKTSFTYFKNGLQFLAARSWIDNYHLSLNLYNEASESAYLNGEFEQMEKWSEIVLLNAISELDKVEAYEIRIRAYTAQSKLKEAVGMSLQVLALLGIKFPEKPKKIHVLLLLIKIKLSMRGRKIDQLSSMPLMKDPYKKAAIRIISSVGSASYFARPDLFPLLALKAFDVMLNYGNTEYSAFLSANYGLILSGGIKEHKRAYEFANLSHKIMEEYPAEHLRCRTFLVIYTFLAHVNIPLKDTFEPLSNGYKYGLQSGDLEFAAYSKLVLNINQFFVGKILTDQLGVMIERNQTINQLKQEAPLVSSKIYTQTVYNLCRYTENPAIMKGPVFEDILRSSDLSEIPSTSAVFDFCTCKLILAYMYEDHEEGLYYAWEGDKYLQASLATTIVQVFYLYQGLFFLQMLKDENAAGKKGMLKKVLKNRNNLKDLARHAPMNYLHKYYLLEAGLNAYYKNTSKATYYYNLSINTAKQNEFLNEEALAIELKGKFHLAIGEQLLAEFYLQRAHELYIKWGALGKVQMLKNKYPNIFDSSNNYQEKLKDLIKAKANSPVNTSATKEISPTVFDLKSIMKAAAAISSDIELDKLLAKLIKISFEYANAEKGFLVLKRDNEFFIEAEGNINNNHIQVLQSVPCINSEIIPNSILQYVNITKENLVINDAVNDEKFSLDPLIVKNNSKSILCIPIKNYGEVVGLLYLENSFITHAFTAERIDILKLLSGQMAVSIENALNEKKKMAAFTEREALLQKINTQEYIISKGVIKTQEYERKKIAEELHDGMGYLLSTLKLNLTALKESEGLNENTEYLKNSFNLLEDSFKELKSISNNLMPDILQLHGLVMAVEYLCKRINDTGKISISFKHFYITRKFKKDFEIEVYRIIQELINNVLKHSEAKNLEIQMIKQSGALFITVEDDGKGFNYTKVIESKRKGRGLLNIVNRVNYLKGKIDYESSRKGTNVMINIPLRTSKMTNTSLS